MTLGAQKTFNTCEFPSRKARSRELKGLGGRQCPAADPTLAETVSSPASAYPGPGTRFAGLSLARYSDEGVGTRRNAAKALGSEGAEPPEEEEEGFNCAPKEDKLLSAHYATGTFLTLYSLSFLPLILQASTHPLTQLLSQAVLVPRSPARPPGTLCSSPGALARGPGAHTSLLALFVLAAYAPRAASPPQPASARWGPGQALAPATADGGCATPGTCAQAGWPLQPCAVISLRAPRPFQSPPEPWCGTPGGYGAWSSTVGGGAGGVAARGRRSRPGCRPCPTSARPGSLEEDSSWERASPRLGRPGMQSRDNGSRKDITEC
nr:PREDICTED: uncharacterized protein LOC109450900 [Rhinolophus sinicus]